MLLDVAHLSLITCPNYSCRTIFTRSLASSHIVSPLLHLLNFPTSNHSFSRLFWDIILAGRRLLRLFVYFLPLNLQERATVKMQVRSVCAVWCACKHNHGFLAAAQHHGLSPVSGWSSGRRLGAVRSVHRGSRRFVDWHPSPALQVRFGTEHRPHPSIPIKNVCVIF